MFKQERNMFNFNGVHEIHHEAAVGNVDAVEILISEGVDCDVRNDFGWTPLMQAVHNNHATVAASLIAHGAQTNSVNNFGASVSSIAAKNGDRKILKLLLDTGATISSAENNGISPLLVASMYGHEEIIEELIDKGICSVNCTADTSRVSSLHVATASLQEGVLKCLLQRGADPYLLDAAACSPIDLVTIHHWRSDVAQRGCLQLLENVRHLLYANSGPYSNADFIDGILEYVNEGDIENFDKILLKMHKNGKGFLKHNMTRILSGALLSAAARGHTKITSQLLNFGVDCNISHTDGKTPLMLAAINGHLDVTKLLLNAGANVFTRCPYTGHTALQLASLQDNVPSELIRLLAQRTLTAGAGNRLALHRQDLDAPLTPQPNKSHFLFPTSPEPRAKSLPGSPSYQNSVLKENWPYSPRKVTPVELMKHVRKQSPKSTHTKVRNWLCRVSNKISRSSQQSSGQT